MILSISNDPRLPKRDLIESFEPALVSLLVMLF